MLGFRVSDGEFAAADTVTIEVKPGAVEMPLLEVTSRDPLGLRFAAMEGVAYQVRYRTNLTEGTWQILSVVPAGPARPVVVTEVPADEQRFYQVIVP